MQEKVLGEVYWIKQKRLRVAGKSVQNLLSANSKTFFPSFHTKAGFREIQVLPPMPEMVWIYRNDVVSHSDCFKRKKYFRKSLIYYLNFVFSKNFALREHSFINNDIIKNSISL